MNIIATAGDRHLVELEDGMGIVVDVASGETLTPEPRPIVSLIRFGRWRPYTADDITKGKVAAYAIRSAPEGRLRRGDRQSDPLGDGAGGEGRPAPQVEEEPSGGTGAPSEAAAAEVLPLQRSSVSPQEGLTKHAAPIHPGTGTDQSVHGDQQPRPSIGPDPETWASIVERFAKPEDDLDFDEIERLQDEGRVDEVAALLQANREAKQRRTAEIERAIALGELDPADAKREPIGYKFPGIAFAEEGWKRLPWRLYHATTALDAVKEEGLKTREELGQERGVGLGGGTSDTISFTEDPEVAATIRDALLEAREVAAGNVTMADMIERAKTGDRGSGPFYDDFIRYYGKDRAEENLAALVEGRRVTRRALPTSEANINEVEVDPWTGVGEPVAVVDGEPLFYEFERPMTPADRDEARWDMYRTFAAFRESAGGPLDPLFFSSDYEALARVDPSQIGVVVAEPIEGARGYRMAALGEWRTVTGDAVEVVEVIDDVDTD